ncbi:hypothetical protein [Streptomyces sclerotialus]|uniref:hypothetical protein n=1 Tax=Streptomyces sclerotialus TaxID=1957 RepID=UPI0004C5F579
MSNGDTARFVRLRVELVMEVTDPDLLTGAALDGISGEEHMTDQERSYAREAVRAEPAEAVAHLIDPFDLVNDVPGVELSQASWSSEETEYDPDSEEWDLGDTGDDEDV